MLLIFDLDDTLYKVSPVLSSIRKRKIINLIAKYKKIDYQKAKNLLESERRKLMAEKKKYTTTAVLQHLRIPISAFYEVLNKIDTKKYIISYKNIYDVLRNISKNNDIVVLSNSPYDIVSKTIQYLKIKKFIKKIYTPEILGDEKPSKKILKKICNDMGYEFENCISIGDSIHKEILPAKFLGMKTVLLINKRHKIPKEQIKIADFVIKDIEELPEILKQVG
ncbi:MAG: HAD family hydrolase [Candidatus Woesearchaeota archaeon]